MRVVALTGLVLGAMLACAWAFTQELEWDVLPGNAQVSGYAVYRAPTCAGPFVKLHPGVLPLTPRLFADTTTTQGATYCWKVVDVSAGGVETSDASSLLLYRIPLYITAPVIRFSSTP
jgi:hypothetical protein